MVELDLHIYPFWTEVQNGSLQWASKGKLAKSFLKKDGTSSWKPKSDLLLRPGPISILNPRRRSLALSWKTENLETTK